MKTCHSLKFSQQDHDHNDEHKKLQMKNYNPTIMQSPVKEIMIHLDHKN